MDVIPAVMKKVQHASLQFQLLSQKEEQLKTRQSRNPTKLREMELQIIDSIKLNLIHYIEFQEQVLAEMRFQELRNHFYSRFWGNQLISNQPVPFDQEDMDYLPDL